MQKQLLKEVNEVAMCTPSRGNFLTKALRQELLGVFEKQQGGYCDWSRGQKTVAAQVKEVRGEWEEHIRRGLTNRYKEFSFYFERNEETLQGFEHRTDIT